MAEENLDGYGDDEYYFQAKQNLVSSVQLTLGPACLAGRDTIPTPRPIFFTHIVVLPIRVV